MNSIMELYKNSEVLHHAYFVVGHKTHEIVDKLKHFLEHIVGINTLANPDVWHGKFDTLTIDHARSITESESRKDITSGKKIFIIEADFITEEAQNSLLKVFEEPTVGTHFFIISPQNILLPTLRSRMQVVLEDFTSSTPGSILDLSFKEKIEKIKDITEGIKDEEKTKQDAIDFINQIEVELYEKGVEKVAKKLEVCEEARNSLYDRGAPVKIILENVVLCI